MIKKTVILNGWIHRIRGYGGISFFNLRDRYLHLHTASLQEHLALRHKVVLATRNYLSDNGFYELETQEKKPGQTCNTGTIKALVVSGQAHNYSRKKVEDLETTAKIYKACGLAWMKVTAEGLTGGISKFFVDKKDENKWDTAHHM